MPELEMATGTVIRTAGGDRAAWNKVLSDDDKEALNRGTSPLHVCSEWLVMYIPYLPPPSADGMKWSPENE